MFCRYECGYGMEDHHKKPNHMKSIKRSCLAQFSHQKTLHMARCDGNHSLPLDPHSSQWKSCSRCMWLGIHIMDVDVCSMHVSQVEGIYMDPIKVRVHCKENLWQAHKNLVGMAKCGWMDDSKWFLTISRYCLLGSEAQKGHLTLAQKPGTFHSVMGLCSSWWYFLFLGCKWSEWDSCPYHHKDLETYRISSHASIRLQQAYFYGCHVWHQQCEIPPIHIYGVRFSSHRVASLLGYHKSANMWRFSEVVECHVGKSSLAYATLETIMFHYGWCPIGTSSIAVTCTLIFYFLLHCLVF
jgi:hypothetical protein